MNPVPAGPLSPELLYRMDAYWHLNRVIKAVAFTAQPAEMTMS